LPDVAGVRLKVLVYSSMSSRTHVSPDFTLLALTLQFSMAKRAGLSFLNEDLFHHLDQFTVL
jgi:hypothetical protein